MPTHTSRSLSLHKAHVMNATWTKRSHSGAVQALTRYCKIRFRNENTYGNGINARIANAPGYLYVLNPYAYLFRSNDLAVILTFVEQ